MSDSWDDYADSWDANPDVATYADKAFDSLCQVISLDGLKVLDFGCGTGKLTEKIADAAASVVGVDTSTKMIAVLRQKSIPNLTPLAGDISSVPITQHPALKGDFDLVVASSVCAFVDDFESTLLVLKSLLKDGGTFIQWDWQRSSSQADFGFTIESITEAYANVGLELVRVTQAFSLPAEDGSMTVLMGIATKS